MRVSCRIADSSKILLTDTATPVISLLIVNSDGFKPSDYDAVFQSAGIASLSYSPPTATLGASDWPTLGSLIDSGKRVITFLDSGADFDSVPYLINEFTNIWETAFDVTDTTFDCNVNRTKGDTATQMYLINHFLDKLVLGQPAVSKFIPMLNNYADIFRSRIRSRRTSPMRSVV
jgi:hypothetical protein